MATEISFATLLAKAVQCLGFDVTSNRRIADEFGSFDSTGVNHQNSHLTSPCGGAYETLYEDLNNLVGQNTIWLHYGNEDPSLFSSPRRGHIRLLKPNDWRYINAWRYIKKYEATGTIAFRTQSLLSHLSTLHGVFPMDMPYALKPGQLPPEQNTDEHTRGGVYFYGSLYACLLYDSVTCHFTRLRQRRRAKQLEDFFKVNVISVLQVTHVMAGPSAHGEKNIDLWSKNMSQSGNAFITGVIIPEDQINDFGVMDLNELDSFLSEMVNILKTPLDFLSPDGYTFLRRYVAGGVFLAHAYTLPLRFVTVGEFEPDDDDEWIAEKFIRDYIVTFIRDDSFSNSENECVKDALMKWVVGGLRKEKVIYDPRFNKYYTLREVHNLFARGEVRKRLEMAKCGLTDNYNSAVRSVVNNAFNIGNSPKKRKAPSEEPGSHNTYNQSGKRHRKIVGTQVIERFNEESDSFVHRPDAITHHLTESIASTIYNLLDGQETQHSSDMFVQHRYESMTTFLQDYQQKYPLLDFTQLINLVTVHIINHRMDWGLYIKKTMELHPICRNGVEGENKADELALHVALQTSNIIEQARRSYAEQPFST